MSKVRDEIYEICIDFLKLGITPWRVKYGSMSVSDAIMKVVLEAAPERNDDSSYSDASYESLANERKYENGWNDCILEMKKNLGGEA